MDNKPSKREYAPAYLHLYTQMRGSIVSGVYPFGSKLPSKRVLAAEAGVSTVTVEHAYALLCDEGYIESRQRSGYFVCFRTDDGFASSAAEVTIAAAAVQVPSDTPDFPFSVLTRTMRSVISDYSHTILQRSPNAGCVQLRQAIRRYLARSRGIHAELEQIIIGSGAEYLYSLIVSMLGRERRYGIESPSYHIIRQVYEASGAVPELLPLGNDGIESAALWASDADVLHITPYRSFPSGVTASASKRHEYLRWAEDGKILVEDDFESEFSVSRKPEETLFSLSGKENVIYMNSFSKTVSTSLRVGYMVLPKPLLPAFEKSVGFYSCTVPTYIQLVLASILDDGDFERHINRVRRQKRKTLSER